MAILLLLLWLYSPLLGLGHFFCFLILYSRQDSLDGASARRKASAYTQNTNRINAHNSDIHTLGGNRTHDPSIPDSSYLRPRGHCDRPGMDIVQFHVFLTSALVDNSQLDAPAALRPGKPPTSTHWTGDWVGPRTGLDALEKRKKKAYPYRH
jgi:hypothetical protein